MRKGLKLISLFALLIFTSCASISGIGRGKLKNMEVQDHKRCVYITKEQIHKNTNQLYWKCRIKILNDRIYEAEYSQQTFTYQEQLKDIKELLNNRIMQANNAKMAESRNDIWKIEHQICILKYSESKDFSNDYNDCRNDLLLNRTPVEPFGKKSYRFTNRDISNPQNLKHIIDENFTDEKTGLTINEQAEITAKLVELFPTCSKYNVKSEEFKFCIKAHNEARKCHDDIPAKIKKRKIDDKMFCKKKAVKDFPDSLALYGMQEEKKETSITKEEKKEPKKGDGLSSLLGITKEGVKTKLTKEQKKEEKTTEMLDANFGPKFSKTEIIELREKSYSKCIKRRNKKLREYRKFLPKECDELGEIMKEENL